jgi:hypothetical protein
MRDSESLTVDLNHESHAAAAQSGAGPDWPERDRYSQDDRRLGG